MREYGALWECSECGESSSPVEAVCHHCGKPLCPNHLSVRHDPAFGAVKGEQVWAVHCAGCRSKHHQRTRSGTAGK
jgi:hypothetical protein